MTNTERSTQIVLIATTEYHHSTLAVRQINAWAKHERKNALVIFLNHGNMERIRKTVNDMARYIDADKLSTYFDALAKHAEMEGLHNQAHLYRRCLRLVNDAPTADVAPRAEVIEEYRKRVYAEMGKYTVFGREYIQRIMREVQKKYTKE